MKYLFGQPTEDGQMQHEDGSYIIKTATGEIIPFTSLEELQANVDEARKAKVRAKYAELQKQDEAETDNGQTEAEAETSAMPLEDVEVADHTYKVKPMNAIVLRVIYKQMGVGGDDSWQALPHSEYILNPNKIYTLTYEIKTI